MLVILKTCTTEYKSDHEQNQPRLRTAYLLLLQMAAFPLLLFTTTAAVLLCGALAGEGGISISCATKIKLYHSIPIHVDAQEVIRNFQATKNSTHITFSWDIVDGYYSSSYISYFHIYYAIRLITGYISTIGSISYSDNSLAVTGSSFRYTTTVTSFGSFGQYVMWVRVYRSSLTPSYSFSDQIYVEVGRSMATCRK